MTGSGGTGSRLRPLLAGACLLLWPGWTAAQAICDNGVIVPEASAPELRERICLASDQALTLFDACGFSLTGPITVRIGEAVPEKCFGVYHCGEARIDLLAPDAMQDVIVHDNAFATLEPQALFDSIVVHELAHALYDGTPCPFDSCLATSEYLAHALQIASLSEEDRNSIMAWRDFEQPIGREEIAAFMYLFAPSVFALKSWLHFSQQEDPCSWGRGILNGSVVMDFPLE